MRLLLLSGLLLAACGGTPPTEDVPDAASPAVDTGPPRPACPASDVASLPTCQGWPIPATGCRVKELDMPNCVDGADMVKVGPSAVCQADVTVVVSWAGWCGYCQGMATQWAALMKKYEGKSVRFVAAMTRNPDYTPPTAEFCRFWRDKYGLSMDLGLDPSQNTVQTILREHAVIDRHGRLRKALDRSDTIVDDIAKAIDEVLANPD